MRATHPLKRLLRYSKSHRSTIWAATACSILNKLFDLAPPLLIGLAVDVVVQREDSLLADFGIATEMGQLWVLTVLTLVVWGLESVFEYAYGLLWRNLAQTIQHELRLDAYGHIQDLDLAYFEDQSTGSLMAILNDDVNQLERFLDGGANDLLQVGTTVVAIGIIYFSLTPLVAVLAFLPIPLVLWGSFWFQARIAPRYADVRDRVGSLNSQLSNNLSGISTIKSFTAEEREVERVRKESQSYREANERAIRLSAAFSPLIRMAIVLGFVATLLVGGWMVLEGQLAVGAYSVLVYMTQRLLWPLTRLGATFDLFQRAMASTKRILDLLDTEIGIQDGPERLPIEEVRGELQFEGVTFAYRTRDPVLRDFDLHVPAGQTIAIVGLTGAGKSTIVKLLLRFYDVTDGELCLDGTPIDRFRLDDLRRAIGLVGQDVFLFHGTVRENIAYGKPDAPLEEVCEAAAVAEAEPFIRDLPEGYDTMIGERGQKLSGGQRQRLSIARAVLTDPPILILDEATSAVDNETEAAIQRSMARIAEGRTTILIAHRLSTVRHADRICVLDDGRIVEDGTHEELLAREGIYADLWNVQTGEVEVQAGEG